MSWHDKLDAYSTDVKYANSINWDWVQWTYLDLDNDARWKKYIMLNHDFMWLWKQIERLTLSIMSKWMKD